MWLFIHLLLISFIHAKTFTLIQKQYSSTQFTWFLYDPSLPPGQVMEVGETGVGVNYLIEFQSNTIANTVIGKYINTNQYILGPRGCDSNRIETSNCASNSYQAQVTFNLINTLWYLDPNDEQCTNAANCMGPLYLSGINKTTNYNNEDLIFSRGVYLKQTYLTNGGIPAVTWVDMVLPNLQFIASNCIYQGRNFSGNYQQYNHDAYGGYIINTTYVFARSDGLNNAQRILIVRQNEQFQIQLSNSDGTGTYPGLNNNVDTFYTFQYISNEFLQDPTAIFNQVFTFTGQDGNLTSNNSCQGSFQIINNVTTPQFNLPVLPNSITYCLNKLFPWFNTLFVCGFHIGAVDEYGNLKYPFCPENQPCGGHAEFQTSNGIPIKVDANTNYLAYSQDCVSFYPYNASFFGFGITGIGSAIYNRMEPDQFTCYSPLYNPSLVLLNTQVNERYRQCFLLGGQLSNGGDVCSKPMNSAKCKQGYIYFGDYCYYKFDVVKQQNKFVVLNEALTVCQTLDSDILTNMEVTPSADDDLHAFLITHFIYWKRQAPGFPYRIPVAGSSCNCYDYQTHSLIPTDDTPHVTQCNCNAAYFPLCRYHVKYYEVIDSYVSISPKTLYILGNGQYGSPWSGNPLTCLCEIGWCGDTCQDACCPYPINSTAVNNPMSIFYSKCYVNGVCQFGDVRKCTCNKGYSPPSSIVNPNDPFQSMPCSCPGSTSNDQNFTISGIQYNNSIYKFNTIPCSGSSHGSCALNPIQNTGICTSTLRYNPLTLGYEPQFNGLATNCRVPRIFYSSPITQSICNNQGTCCPFGQSAGDHDGNVNACDNLPNGCICNNGYGGESCTCVTPYTYPGIGVLSNITLTVQFTIGVLEIQTIQITNKTDSFDSTKPCIPMQVYLSNDGTTQQVRCYLLITNNQKYWNCNANIGYAFVIIILQNPSLHCNVQVTESFFNLCGNNTNPTSGRFSANEHNRQFGMYKELQPLGATGCTNSECMCDQNHIGVGCKTGISSIEIIDPSSATITKLVCGETTLQPRGTLQRQIDTGQLDYCLCNSLSTDNGGIAGPVTSQFTGDACECLLVYNKALATNLLCNNKGNCITPQFPSGTCLNDLNNYENDALYNSNLQLDQRKFLLQANSQFTLNNITYTIVNNNLIFATNDLYANNISTCYSQPFTISSMFLFSQTSLRITTFNVILGVFKNDCDACLCYPNGDLVYHNNTNCVIFVQEKIKDLPNLNEYLFCNTLVIDNPHEYYNNSADNRTLDYTRECILNYTYQLHDEVFFSQGEITGQIQFPCATGYSLSINNAIYGNIKCNNFVQRIMDYSLQLSVPNYTMVCANQTIKPHSNEIGFGFGLFNTEVVSFLQPDWTNDQYSLIAGLINNQIYYKYNPNTDLNETWIPIDEYGLDLYIQSLNPISNLTRYNLSFTYIPKYLFIVINDTINTVFTITIPIQLDYLLVYNTFSEVCTTIITPKQGDVFTIYCPNLLGFKLIPHDAFYYDPMLNITLNVVAESINVLYDDLYLQIQNLIVLNKTLPYNSVLNIPPGVFSRSIHYDTDTGYLKQIFYTYLSRRKCSVNEECSYNGAGSTCIFDDLFYRPWEPSIGESIQEGLVGIEGGCRCNSTYETGFYTSIGCDSCLAGYGPDPSDFVNITFCNLPLAYDVVCGLGGNGYEQDTQYIESSLYIYQDVYGVKYTPQCTWIEYNNEIYVNTNTSYNLLEYQSFASGSGTINVFGDVPYLNGNDIENVTCQNDFFITLYSITSPYIFNSVNPFVLRIL